MSVRKGLLTTVIGSYPKPCYCKNLIPDWFAASKKAYDESCGDQGVVTDLFNAKAKSVSAMDREKALLRATKQVLDEQADFGIDVPTDGEVRRENYIHHLCRSIEGISFENLTRTKCRPRKDESTGETVYAYEARLPTVVGPVRWRCHEGGSDVSIPRDDDEGQGRVAASAAPAVGGGDNGSGYPPSVVVEEWKLAQAQSPDGRAVKYTLPGPMTIIGTVANQHYVAANGFSEEQLARDLAVLIKGCVDALAKAGCRQIQIDEPLFARRPDEAIQWGIGTLDSIVADVPAGVMTTCHICCGYPQYLDHDDYVKADNDAYIRLAPHLAKTSLSAISLEDAHRPNDLSKLLPALGDKTIVLGSVKIASSKVETVEAIEERLRQALEYMPADRLMVAPDCGLGYLTPELVEKKLRNMVEAAQRVGCQLKRSVADESPPEKRLRFPA